MGVILIAFERESEQSALEQLLAAGNHRVVRSANGLAALDAARREPPDLIVSDIVLPRMDGFALCRKWKQDERLQSIPFVFYTRRHDDPKYERFARELGAERFLARSAAPQALTATIDELLAKGLKNGVAGPAAPSTPPRDHAAQQRAAAAAQKALQTQRKDYEQQLERAQQELARVQSRLESLEISNQRLAAGEARFRSVFESNPAPIWIADRATGGFIAVNDAALNLFGYTRSEFLALQASALQLNDAEQSAGVRMYQSKDGRTLALAVVTRDIEFDERRAQLAAACDLSERVAQESRLREQAGAGRAVLEAAADGCWLLDAEGRILDVNAAYCSMSGYSRAELLKMNAADIEDHSVGESTMRLQLDRASGGGRYETRHRRRDGALMEVEVSVGLSADGRGSVVLIRDNAQRRRDLAAQRALQRRNEFTLDLFRRAATLDESGVVRRLIDQAAAATSSPLSFFYFVNAAEQTVSMAAWRARGQAQAVMGEGVARPMAGLLADCVRKKRAVLSAQPSVLQNQDGLPDMQRRLIVPVMDADQVVALLGVADRDGAYDEDDQQTLVALGDAAWRIIGAKRDQAHTMRALQRVDVALQGMIESFVRVSERHDPYTAGSARRLAALAVALGREVGLDGERQHVLRIAALLHDVGNIAVPAAILAKPAPLTESELALMRTHVEEGCQLLADIDFGGPVADIVYQSHERWDGSGYPRGLQGEEVLLEARILAVADTVEAMCSPRPYRPAAGMDAALEEIMRGAGRLYDPQIVAACVRLVRERGFVLPE
ncbi:MAG TPA: HD domain-containing phosphohydrolase [Steroidobacter sp.]|nr:HD domain-containing phosphohydrolase [Steroidobacter sp.]